MKNDLSIDSFDCPHCGIKSVMYSVRQEDHEYLAYTQEEMPTKFSLDWGHYLVECKRENCQRLTYIKVKTAIQTPGHGWLNLNPREVEIQYPSNNSSLPEYIPENIKKYYKEALEAYNFNLLSSASIMCRKVIYEICDKQKVEGVDYKEKIKNLGFDKRITDPLLNIKNIGDETVHARGWDKITIQKAIDVLGIIIDMIYIQENRIKDFTNHYSQNNQVRKETSEAVEK
jgi:hypothetical protein